MTIYGPASVAPPPTRYGLWILPPAPPVVVEGGLITYLLLLLLTYLLSYLLTYCYTPLPPVVVEGCSLT